jgi:hypothetical protein
VIKPEVISVEIGGMYGASYEITYDRRTLRYYSGQNGFLPEKAKPTIIKPSDEQWQAFFDELDQMNAWKWKRYYINPKEHDGTAWSVVVSYPLQGSRDVLSSGSNAYPPNFQQFLAAVRKLIGGREFR